MNVAICKRCHARIKWAGNMGKALRTHWREECAANNKRDQARRQQHAAQEVRLAS